MVRRLLRRAAGLGAPALALLLATCVDTSIPDLSQQLGNGRTDGPYCSPEVIDTLPAETLKIHIIDVGQGDAIWVQTPWTDSEELESLDILIDAGSSGSLPGTPAGGAIVVDYLASHGLNVGEIIDTLVITHAHEDHYGGVPAVAAAYQIANYVDPGYTASSNGFLGARGAAMSDVQQLHGKSTFPAIPNLVAAQFGAVDIFGPLVTARLLWSADVPPSGNATNPDGADVNNTSIAFSLEWAGRRVLLMGDCESEVESKLVESHDVGQVALSANVLKVGHHGSATASSPTFLSRVFPSPDTETWAVISSGRRLYGGQFLPSDEVVARLKAVLKPYHVLSTENRDEAKDGDTSQGDDHVIITIGPLGTTQACYAL